MYINRTLGSWLLTLGSLLLTLSLMAEVYTPYTVPNPRTTDGSDGEVLRFMIANL